MTRSPVFRPVAKDGRVAAKVLTGRSVALIREGIGRAGRAGSRTRLCAGIGAAMTKPTPPIHRTTAGR